jgi:Domain of unknown function (DUF4191)
MAEPEKQGQMAVLKDAFALTRREKPLSLLYCALLFVVVLVVSIIIGKSLHHPVYFGILGIPLSLLAAFFLFTRFANTAAFSSIEGQVGAAASVLMSIRKGFTTTPAVAVSRNQDMVHRSVGRAGIVLVGEGSSAVRQLLIDEKRKMERFIPGIAVTDLIVGDGEGQVKLRKLQKTMKKLPKALSKNQVREVRNRVKAIGGMNMPIPKGPLPKGAKVPRR